MIRIGEIGFLNSLPLSLTIEDDAQIAFLNKHPSEIISAPPKVLNQKMLDAQLDISPVSSVFYLKNKKQFELMTNCCIASDGPVESVLWFYNQNLGAHLDKVFVPDTSETSILLLKWLMHSRGVTAETFEVYPRGDAAKLLLEGDVALLSIGDEALMLSAACYEDIPFTERYEVIDVASEWREQTGFPCVFATWIIQKQFMKTLHADSTVLIDLANFYRERLEKFETDFSFQQHVIRLAREKYSVLSRALGDDVVRHYLLNALTYDFGPAQQDSLARLEVVCGDIEDKQLQGIA